MKQRFLSILLTLILSVALVQAQGRTLAPDGVEGETYYAPFPVAITLDGEFNDWNGVPVVNMGQGVGRPSMDFSVAADATHLYFYARIIDSLIISGQHGNDFWNEDSLEIYFNGTGDLTHRSYTDGIAQLTIPPLNIGVAPEAATLAGVRGSTLNAQVIAVATDNGWAVEVAIPLQSDIWSIEPVADGVMGFQVHLNAASEFNRDSKLSWSILDTSDTSYQNPSVFGQLIFYPTSSEPVATGEYFFRSELAENGLVDDFENGIWLSQSGDTMIGYAPQNAILAIQQVLQETGLSFPNQEVISDNVLALLGDGTFSHNFTDGLNTVTQDWSGYNAFGLWLYGADAEYNLHVYNGAETATYTLTDAFTGWKHVIVPFGLFTGELDLSAISGYGVSGNNTYIDDAQLFNVENPSQIILSDATPQGVLILDPTINWESRQWELLWSDEFDAEANTAINDENWTCEIGGSGWGNNELEYYTTALENVSHNGDGQLVITAMQGQPESGMCWYGRCAFTSARCITEDKVEFTYGRVEARLQIPRGQGIWPAFWMLGANFREVGWPQSGEIDIMENVGHITNTTYGTVHGPGYSGGAGIGNANQQDYDFADDFHVYAVEWDPGVIRWYVDGELFGIVSVNNLRNQEWVFDHDFFLLMNVAVGGAWPGHPNETTVFPQQMLVDYVRVYQLAD